MYGNNQPRWPRPGPRPEAMGQPFGAQQPHQSIRGGRPRYPGQAFPVNEQRSGDWRPPNRGHFGAPRPERQSYGAPPVGQTGPPGSQWYNTPGVPRPDPQPGSERHRAPNGGQRFNAPDSQRYNAPPTGGNYGSPVGPRFDSPSRGPKFDSPAVGRHPGYNDGSLAERHTQPGKRSFDGQVKPSGTEPISRDAEFVDQVTDTKDQRVILDDFNCDLNMVVDGGFVGFPLTQPIGFCFCWAGVRATHGVYTGKVCFDVTIQDHLPVYFEPDHVEQDPHVVRVGWSRDETSFQLGEEPHSYGYGGTGRFSSDNKFQLYGQSYGLGDVITALIDFDTSPPKMSFCKNGNWLGVAMAFPDHQIGVKEQTLFPHILSKNCRFLVNFGQLAPLHPPPPGFVYINQATNKVRGMVAPTSKQDCQIVMIVGLPGSGKTTLALKTQKERPDKRYNIIGTDTLIDKMKVNGLPRKRNYHGRWDALIKLATAALNTIFKISSQKCRNYILDQTNVYRTARRRKMQPYYGFQRHVWVLVTNDNELERRSIRQTEIEGKVVPESAVLEMKANFSLPEVDEDVDAVKFIELGRDESRQLVAR